MFTLPDQDLRALLDQFERSDWRELRLRMKGFELLLAKDATPQYREFGADEGADSAVAPQSADAGPLPDAVNPTRNAPIPAGCTLVRAPSLGTFYRAPKPGAPAFVDVGSDVTADTEVCLIEVMKLFTTVRAGVSGRIREIYPKDAELVEFDRALFLVEPNV
jgi:acetyl-CoA carboxylase biotin carboxyl carrier protein